MLQCTVIVTFFLALMDSIETLLACKEYVNSVTLFRAENRKGIV